MDNIKKEIFDTLESFKDLFDNAHDLIHILDLDGRVIYINRSWTETLGYEQSEMEGKSIYPLVAESDREEFIQYRDRIIENVSAADPSEFIVRFNSKNGNQVYLEGFVTTKTVNGKPMYTRGIFRDVTKRLRNEAQLIALNKELKENEFNIKQLLHYAPDGIVVIDAQSIIQYWNPKAEQIFGWRFDEVVGHRLTEIIIPVQYRRAHEEGMRRFLSTGEAKVLNKTIEITSLNKDGKEFYVALTISQTLQKGQTAFIAFIRDVDQQKKDSLELEQKKEALEASNAQLEQFAHVTSHDMKEPIRKIQIFADLLSTSLSTSESIENPYLRKIQAAATRLGEMVDGVLRYSSIKTEVFPMEKVDLNVILREIRQDLEIVFNEKGGTLLFEKLPTIEGAKFLLYQLFYNMILNSLKFSKKNVPPVIEVSSAESIRVGDRSKQEKFYEIKVKDNGIGFNQKDANTIFKTFSRLNSKEFPGTGLGLALCRSIVERHHGQIEAEGKESEGSVFTIRLPQFAKFPQLLPSENGIRPTTK